MRLRIRTLFESLSVLPFCPVLPSSFPSFISSHYIVRVESTHHVFYPTPFSFHIRLYVRHCLSSSDNITLFYPIPFYISSHFISHPILFVIPVFFSSQSQPLRKKKDILSLDSIIPPLGRNFIKR